MRARYAPPIAIEPGGAHWYRSWLMLRDAGIYFPWYDRRRAAQRGVPADFDGERLHRRTLALLDRRDGHSDVIRAALDDDAAAALARHPVPTLVVRDPSVPLFAHADRLTDAFPAIPSHDAIDPEAIAAYFAQ